MYDFYSIRSLEQVPEFHYILPINNIPSVIEHGILSHEKVKEYDHDSVAMNEIQEIRKDKQVPNGLMLHQYVNLYFHARNPMITKLMSLSNICILRVNKEIIYYPEVVITDRNASSIYVSFISIAQSFKLDFVKIYAKDWRDQDKYSYFSKKSQKCAEILVPYNVPYSFIAGLYVKNDSDIAIIKEKGFDKEITIEKELFLL
jgi:hypothetical protein